MPTREMLEQWTLLRTLLALVMGRGNRIELQGDEIVLFGTNGTTEVSRQPFTRLPAPANPTATVG